MEKSIRREGSVNIFSPTFQALEKSLNVATLQQRTISTNIANINTPNYKAQGVDFKSYLEQALSQGSSTAMKSHRTHSTHVPFSTEGTPSNGPKVFAKQNTSFNHDGNNVDLDYEMSQLAKNQLWYSALTDRMSGQINSLRNVISGGK